MRIFPDAPRGATVFARYIAYHRFSGNRSVRYTRLQLMTDKKGRDTFGNNLRTLKDVLPPSVDMEKLLLESTPIGFYGAALSDERRALWIDGVKGPRAIKEFAPDGGTRCLVKKELYFCPGCIEEDEDAYGLGYWRVTHQLPSVHHCPIHFTPLCGTCLNCSKHDFANTWVPPSRICPVCKDSKFAITSVPDSQTYRRYLKLIARIYCGENVGIAPQHRVQTYAKFMSCLPESAWSEKIDRLLAVVLNAWGCASATELEARLDAPFSRIFVERAVRGEDAIVNPAGHLAIMAAICSEGLPQASAADLNTPGEQPQYDEPTLMLANRCGVPPIVILKALEGLGDLEITQRYQLWPGRIRRVRKEMAALGMFASEMYVRSNGTLGSRLEAESCSINSQLKYRTRILKAISDGATSRAEVRKIADVAVRWCYAHDSAWLQETLPVKERVFPDQSKKREIYREQICAYLSAHPHAFRSEVEQALRSAYGWCRRFDRTWLEEHLPPRHKIT